MLSLVDCQNGTALCLIACCDLISYFGCSVWAAPPLCAVLCCTSGSQEHDAHRHHSLSCKPLPPGTLLTTWRRCVRGDRSPACQRQGSRRQRSPEDFCLYLLQALLNALGVSLLAALHVMPAGQLGSCSCPNPDAVLQRIHQRSVTGTPHMEFWSRPQKLGLPGLCPAGQLPCCSQAPASHLSLSASD